MYTCVTTIAKGEGSHAEGGGTKAQGKYSHAEGESIIEVESNNTTYYNLVAEG
jgi:hypothetical protein